MSVLVPVRNEELYLGALCESLLRQVADFELVIVDDFSTDGTATVAENFAARDCRVRFYRNNGNQGVAAAMSLAYFYSRGQFVAMAGGDDTVRPNYFSELQRCTRNIDGHEVNFVAFSKLMTVSEDARYDGQVCPRGNRGNRSVPCTLLSRRLGDEIFPLPAGLHEEDAWIGFLAESLADVVREIPVAIYNYRIHAANTNPRQSNWRDFDYFMRRYNQTFTILRREKGSKLRTRDRERLDILIRLGAYRDQGRTLAILATRSATLVQRLRVASQSSRTLYALRSHFYKAFSGW